MAIIKKHKKIVRLCISDIRGIEIIENIKAIRITIISGTLSIVKSSADMFCW